MFQLSDFHYELPEELIAQQPLLKRSDSRLMVVAGANLSHCLFSQLPTLLNPGDRLILNNTRVVSARIFGQKASGGKLELMLERPTASGSVLAKVRSSKSPRPGSLVSLNGRANHTITARVIARQDDLFELREVQGSPLTLAQFIEQHGDIPLPPYIKRSPNESDKERYQTVFASQPGAVAAPTAGLHFDEAMLASLGSRGIDHSYLTLHVGAGTFQPVRVEDPSNHVMHAERISVPRETVDAIKQTRAAGGRIIAVGTTCVRSLEAVALLDGGLQPFSGETQLFLKPGCAFNVVDGIITNFHLPESTLLMLVAAFAGMDVTMTAYQQAVEERYRFFSYGDAMLVWPPPETVKEPIQ